MASRSLSQFVLKVHSRCDLACDHCYVYEHADQSWRDRPITMAPETVKMAAERIAEHASAHDIGLVHVVLHGGEPLLLGYQGLAAVLERLRSTIEPVTRLDLRMQTNGVRLTEELCELFGEHGLKVGVSFDGDERAHDRHRRFAHGGGSHAEVIRAIELLRRPEFRRSYAGLLCTIDIANDPVVVYDALAQQEPPRIDLLLPHATWDQPPPGPPGGYARWLLAVYDRWSANGRPMPIRLFESLIAAGRGERSGAESVGLDPVDLAVIEADGAWEQPDSMKTAYAGAPATGLDIFTSSADEVAADPGIVARGLGLAALSATCHACTVVQQCGGGLYAHRFRSANGFDNPSVFCTDLKELITAMNSRPLPPSAALDDLPGELLDDLGSNGGSEASMRYLAERQLEIMLGLFHEVGADHPGLAWDTLMQLSVEHAAEVHDVLLHPFVRTWAVELLSGDHDEVTPAYLGSIAAAAATRAGVDVTLPVPVLDGWVHLPTLGCVAARTDAAMTQVRTAGLQIARPVRPLGPDGVGRDGFGPALEDGDPIRHCFNRSVTGRLSDDEAALWRRTVTDAWATIRRDGAAHVPGLQIFLRSVVPIEPERPGGLQSATYRHAFGAIASTPMPDGQAMASTIVHEFRHNILNAVMDIGDLFAPDDRTLITVGWRSDPRPVEGALQGTFAHLAVAGLWRAWWYRSGAAQDEQVFVRYRDWSAEAAERLLDSGTLTLAGDRLARRMGETLSSWQA